MRIVRPGRRADRRAYIERHGRVRKSTACSNRLGKTRRERRRTKRGGGGGDDEVLYACVQAVGWSVRRASGRAGEQTAKEQVGGMDKRKTRIKDCAHVESEEKRERRTREKTASQPASQPAQDLNRDC